MTHVTSIAATAAAAGGGAIAAILFAGIRGGSPARVLPFLATALAAAAGGFLASRGVSAEHLIVIATVSSGLAAAAGGTRLAAVRDVLALGLVVTLGSSLLDRDPSVPLAAMTGLAFAPSAARRGPRATAVCCALVVALVCATFGFGLGLVVLTTGIVLALVATSISRGCLTMAGLIPAMAITALAALLVETALTV